MATGCVKILKKAYEFDHLGKFIPENKRGKDVDLFRGENHVLGQIVLGSNLPSLEMPSYNLSVSNNLPQTKSVKIDKCIYLSYLQIKKSYVLKLFSMPKV